MAHIMYNVRTYEYNKINQELDQSFSERLRMLSILLVLVLNLNVLIYIKIKNIYRCKQ